LYEHVKDASSKYEKQTIDTATAEQQEEQPLAKQEGEEVKEDDDVEMVEEEPEQQVINYTHSPILHSHQNMGSNPGRVKPKTIKLVFVASPLSTQH
jgi:hypothetical protein